MKTKFNLTKQTLRKLIFAMLFFTGLCNTAIYAQATTIKGVITDEIGAPLPGASVLETGTQNGVTSDFDGNYVLQVKTGGALTFSYLGYKTVTIEIKGQTIINVQLSPDVNQLEETVIIGYGSVQRKDVTGSVATVKMEQLKAAPVANFDQAMAGRVAGVQVSAGDGQPGSGLNIVIRGGNTVNGDNSPLYVVDGFIMENFNPGLIDPSDIESISVLKDASATAIYGVRGANGVIIITGKKAKLGKTKISYETRLDVKDVSKKLDVLDAYEYIKLGLEINESSTESRFFTLFNEETQQNEIVGGLEDYKNVQGNNWQDEGFRTAYSKSHKLKISSGGDKTRFNASLNAIEDQGSLLKSEYNRINGRVTLNHKVNEKLDVSTDVIYTNYIQDGLNTKGTSSYSFMRNLVSYAPVLNKFRDYGDFDQLNDVNDDYDLVNIVSWHPIVSLKNEYRRSETDQFIANLGLKYKVTSNLILETKGSFSSQFRNVGTFNNSKTVYGRLVNKIDGINGSISNRRWKNFSNVNTLTYKRKFNDHSINALAGITLNVRKYTSTFVRSIDIPQYLEGLGINSIDGGTLDDGDDNHGDSESRIFSVLGRLNYSYKDRYLFTASIRRDGSSNFPEQNRIGYFPSTAVSWKADEESFIKDLNIFSQLKFKAGYGKTGNDRIPGSARFEFLTDSNSSYFFDGETIQGQRPTSFGANPNLFWETTEQFNVGIDVGFLDNRISLAVEAYQKDTKDLLINADAALSQGFSSIWTNSGQVRNKGLEFALNTVNVSTKDFKWTSDFNISFNQNTIVSLPEGKPIFGKPNYYWRYSSNQFIVEEGKPLGNIYGYISDGVYQPNDFENYDPTAATHTLASGQPYYKAHQPGDEKYKDLNGDGQINGADKTIIGNALPKHFGGFGNTFTYKNFELSAFLQWSYGNDILNANRLVFEGMTVAGQNQLASVLDRWTPENMDTDMHRAGGQGFEDISSRIVEDGSYIRLKTVNATYRFPKTALDKIKLSSLELFVSAQNLITWTDYSGFDPDVSVSNSLLTPGIDYSAYPKHRTISLGLQVSF
ncbi:MULTISPECIES: SusC/RagA family TonB-linked outer membrane protein [Flavobacteriaceae]|uniref:TonB-dependent receptor n=2 Tax=Flavobacteriaceae TaxID=49546 RepID=A0A4Y8ARX9_9FLAO|nr:MULTISPECIES: TonB-dependent receptor [Flavobacteriaceae]TEW72974.1 TonB-dependent receptor [Gramella jeungdoensis]GGK48063.1 SusC/RagA family TonB-linked outer membrane protein [Lutibacter litoralis]